MGEFREAAAAERSLERAPGQSGGGDAEAEGEACGGDAPSEAAPAAAPAEAARPPADMSSFFKEMFKV